MAIDPIAVSDAPDYNVISFENPVGYQVYTLNVYPTDITAKSDIPVPFRKGELDPCGVTVIDQLPLEYDWQLDIYKSDSDVGNSDKALTSIVIY